MKTTSRLETCKASDVGVHIEGEGSEVIVDALDTYFSDFIKPIKEGVGNILSGNLVCWKCGSSLNGFLGTFRWGIQNGEGYCSKCEWPCRGLHRPKDSDGDEVFEQAIPAVLQYSPKYVTSDPAQHQ